MKLRPTSGLLLATLMAGGAAAQTTPLRVVTWNLEHFVDPYDDPYVQNEMEDEGAWKNPGALDKLAQAIVALDADILALQEVENDRTVKLFLDTFVPDHGYKFFAGVSSIEWYQNVVVASRVPLGPITSWREVGIYNDLLDRTENKYNARIMSVEVRGEGYTFDLVNVHLKAGGDDKDVTWRLAQVDLLHDWFRQRTAWQPERNVMVLGDFNLVPDSPEYNALVRDTAYPLFDPAEAQGFPATHPSSGPRRRIDHVLFNSAMAPDYLTGSLAVGAPLSLNDLAGLTDHLPVVVTINPSAPPATE